MPTWFVTHTFDSDHCPRRYRCLVTGGYRCTLLPDDVECTGRNCPALTPGSDTLDLGVPCTECGGTDGWVCECSFSPASGRNAKTRRHT
jgi:hypothetical protein